MGRRQVRGGRHGRQASEAKERFWRGHLLAQRSGGLSIRDYCTRHDLTEPSFYAWRREIGRRDRLRSRAVSGPASRNGGGIRGAGGPLATGFVRLEVQPASSCPAAPIEIVLPSGSRILVPPGATRGQLHKVLSALQRVSAEGSRSC